MKKNKIQIIICCFFLCLFALPGFSNEFSLEIICGDFFPSQGFINLIAENKSENKISCFGFKRGVFAVFLVVKSSGELIKDPGWELHSYRSISSGGVQRCLPPKRKQYFSSVTKQQQCLIENFLKEQNENLYITALVHENYGKKLLMKQAPFYKLQFKKDILICEKVDEIMISNEAHAAIKKEREIILMEEASPDYIYH